YGLEWSEAEALEWAKRRGARSRRIAWHFIVELAGRAGRPLTRSALSARAWLRARSRLFEGSRRIALQLDLRRHPCALDTHLRSRRLCSGSNHAPDDAGRVVADQQRSGPIPRNPGRPAVRLSVA